MEKINQVQLLKLLQEVDGGKSSFISIIALTDPKLKKTNNPFLGTLKLSKVQGIINFNYQNSVHNQLERENKPKEDYKPGERKYGIKADEHNGCLLYGAGDTKLVIKVEKTLKPRFVYANRLISKEKIEEFLPNRTGSNTQGTENEIVVRNYNLSSIKKIRINKKVYKIV